MDDEFNRRLVTGKWKLRSSQPPPPYKFSPSFLSPQNSILSILYTSSIPSGITIKPYDIHVCMIYHSHHMIHEMTSYSTKILTSSIFLLICAFFTSRYFPTNSNHHYVIDTSFNASLIEALPIHGAFGPESFTFGPGGDGPYAGVSDGRIVKWLPHQHRWIDFAFTSPNRCTSSSSPPPKRFFYVIILHKLFSRLYPFIY